MHAPTDAEASMPTRIMDCWNRIGVQGDGSCPQLEQYVHCRNCPVYAAAAVALLDRAPPPGYLADWTHHYAQEQAAEQVDVLSVFIFRIGVEWLALPTPTFAEVAELRSIHSLPNRRSGVVLGLTNVRGELLVCVSLGTVLGLDTPESNRDRQRIAQRRLLVIGGDGERMAFPVDEVHGIHRIDLHDLKEVPGTVARATAPYSKAIFAWQQNTVGLLNERLLLHTLSRSLG